jgi:hypothetical protein
MRYCGTVLFHPCLEQMIPPVPPQELLASNLENCKANLKTCDTDLGVINDNITTIEVSQSRVWNHDVERRRVSGAAAAAGSSS